MCLLAHFTRSALLTRKSIAAWKELFFADFFALFASWRLMPDSTFTTKSAKKTLRTQFGCASAAPH